MLNFFTNGMPSFSLSNWKAWSLWLALMLFPFFAAGAKSGASIPFAWAVLMGLIYGWKEAKALYPWERQLFIGFTLLFITIFISAIFGEDAYNDFRRLDKFAAFLFIFPAYLAIRRYIQEPARPFIAGLLIAPLGSLLFGIDWEWDKLLPALTLTERLHGYYATIILSNITSLMTFLLLSVVIIFMKRWSGMLFSSVPVLLGLIVILASASRSGILFIPVGLMAIFFLLRKNMNQRHVIIAAAILLVVTIIVAVNPNNVSTQRIKMAVAELFDGKGNADKSVSYRFEMWNDSITMWLESPFIGVGPGSFEAVGERLSETGEGVQTTVFGHAHSIYFDALASLGIIGFIAMLWFAFIKPLSVGWVVWKTSLSQWQLFYSTGLIVTILAFMTFGLTEAWFSRNPMFRSYLLCMAIMFVGIARHYKTIKLQAYTDAKTTEVLAKMFKQRFSFRSS